MRHCHRLLYITWFTAVYCCPGIANSQRFAIQADPVPLNALHPNQRQLEALEWVAGWSLSTSNKKFGGLSGFERVGNTLFAISDRGYWVILTLQFDANGVLVDIPYGAIHPILSPMGTPLEGKLSDAEELILRPDGRVLVTFEHAHRVSLFGNITASKPPFYTQREQMLAPLPSLADCPPNGGVEAATWHPEFGLIAIREHAVPGTTEYPVWISNMTATRQLTYRGSAIYHPTGMTHLQNGDLITIERHYQKSTGPISRLVRISKKHLGPTSVNFSGKALGHFKGKTSRDNFEAVTTAPRVSGRPTVLIGSDDNYAAHQRTFVIQVRLD